MKNKLKELLVVYTLKTVIGVSVCGLLVGACGCAEMLVGESTEYTTEKVLYLGDYAVDAEGTSYTVKTKDYKYGDIISVTLNQQGKIVGINGRCLIQTLE